MEMIKYLKARLPHAEWCIDYNKDGFANWNKAMLLAGNDPCVHMEEDIILTVNFVEKLEKAISEHPNDLIQFFSMRKKDITEGSRWDNNFLMNQCFYMPAGFSLDCYNYNDEWDKEERAKNPAGWDLMMDRWLKARKRKYWIHVPSLVEHRIAKSAVDKRRSSKRQSKTFVDPWL
ncbi:hypothetical protein EBU24_06545 [bacterium]|nr:hypothetical protein [bacterium]